MTAHDDRAFMADAARWGSELDHPSAETLAQAERLIAEHYEIVTDTCLCAAVLPGSYAAHLVQVLASAGLLAVLADLDERPADAPPPRRAVRRRPFVGEDRLLAEFNEAFRTGVSDGD